MHWFFLSALHHNLQLVTFVCSGVLKHSCVGVLLSAIQATTAHVMNYKLPPFYLPEPLFDSALCLSAALPSPHFLVSGFAKATGGIGSCYC